MNSSLEQLDYKGIFKYFSEISNIPRGSGNEQGISDYLVAFAKAHQLEYIQDKARNVIIIKEATPGYEKEPVIMLQGHMDMVCEKKKDATHDFLKDGIKLIVEDDYIHADETTLGGDNGIALAYMMALLTDKELKHPRIEAVITSDEEVGMHGAKALDTSSLKARYMINLDSEEEGFLLSSCAGGLTGTSNLPVKRVSENGKLIKVSIGGLKGGHSGQDIHRNRTNANKLLGRLLFDLREKVSFGLVDMQGGFKDNVIPREANATILIMTDSSEPLGDLGEEKKLNDRYQKAKDAIAELMGKYQTELTGSEPDLNYDIEDLGNGEYNPLHPVSFEKVLFMLINMPYGVQVMSSDIEGLVESSLNLGIFRIEEDKAVFCNSVRSSKSSYKHYVSDRLNYMVSFLGGDYYVRSEYPAWEFRKKSLLREHCKRIYRELTGEEMKVAAIHAGLECGLISEKLPGIDIVSIGPDMYHVHTIEEKLSISSTIRVYKFLETVIKEKIDTK